MLNCPQTTTHLGFPSAATHLFAVDGSFNSKLRIFFSSLIYDKGFSFHALIGNEIRVLINWETNCWEEGFSQIGFQLLLLFPTSVLLHCSCSKLGVETEKRKRVITVLRKNEKGFLYSDVETKRGKPLFSQEFN